MSLNHSRHQRSQEQQSKGDTVVAGTIFAKKCFYVQCIYGNEKYVRDYSTWWTIDVVRLQQLRCKECSSLTRKAALSADVLLCHQDVPRPPGLSVNRAGCETNVTSSLHGIIRSRLSRREPRIFHPCWAEYRSVWFAHKLPRSQLNANRHFNALLD